MIKAIAVRIPKSKKVIIGFLSMRLTMVSNRYWILLNPLLNVLKRKKRLFLLGRKKRAQRAGVKVKEFIPLNTVAEEMVKAV
jgi:hypothetical protein